MLFSLFFFNIRFNRALINHSGAMVLHRYFQSVIGPLNKDSIRKNQHFFYYFFFNFIFNRALFSCSGAVV